MKKKVLIVEDQFVEANDLQLMLTKAGYEVCGIARSVPVALEIIQKENPGLVLVDIFLKGSLTGIDLARQLKEEGIAFIYLSANSNEEILAAAKTTEPYGFIVKPFREKDLLVTLEIAQYRHEHSRESRYRRETEMIRQLDQVVSRRAGSKEKWLQTAKILQAEIPFDYLAIGFDDPGKLTGSALSFLRIGFDEYQTLGAKELATITGLSLEELVRIPVVPERERVAAFYNNEAFEAATQQPSLKRLVGQVFQLRSLLSFPLSVPNGEAYSCCFYSRKQDAYSADHIALLHRIQPILLNHVDLKPAPGNADSFAPVVNSSPQPSGKAVAAPAPDFDGIIGKSHLMLMVFDQICQVAPVDTSVLVLGETGTGKERIAQCIHNLSPRKGKALVKINCAALPPTLIESELFGHEKGAFTGALTKRIGKFEQADGGTIFLDEIGEMPVDLQVKLLRVLQEKEIDPIGGRSSVKIDVRVIAATNRNLEKEVAEGRFRLDLYYRLNVFPIVIPPLRERMEDLPLLAQHFIEVYSRKTGKMITGLSENALKTMRAYHWPGNIRELEHQIERCVLMARGTLVEDTYLPLPAKSLFPPAADLQTKTIHENERDHIIGVLKKCGGKIWGAGGAAELLNVPPSTLKSKMKKLGIQKETYGVSEA